MDKLAILPGIVSIWLLARYGSSQKVFLIWFLPVLTLIPAYYETKLVEGLPEISFWSAALLPVFLYWLLKEGGSGYYLHWLDVFIILHLAVIFYAQNEATGYKDAQKILYREVLQRLVPYLLVRIWFSAGEFRVQFLKMVVILAAFMTIIMLIEAKWFINLSDFPFRKIWPFSVPWDGVMQRSGIKRAAAAFAHPISAGYFYAMVFPISVWLVKEGHWKNTSNGWIAVAAVALGALLSVSRAPIMGVVLATGVLFYGWSQIKSVQLFLVSGILVVVSVTVIPVFISYVSISRAQAVTKDQENAAYRKEMLDNYFTVIADRPYWGYGRYTYPVVNRQVSIDNEYLFMALTSGLVSLGLYVLLLIAVPLILAVFLFRSDAHNADTRLAWAILAAWFSALFTQATVYAGNQTIHYFYMLAGMAAALPFKKSSILPSWNSIRVVGGNLENPLCRTV